MTYVERPVALFGGVRLMLSAAFAAITAFAAPSYAAGVQGALLNVTGGGVPVANAEVRLLGIKDNATTRTLTAHTDAEGKFRFRRVSGEAGQVFRLETTFAGQRQASDPFVVGREDISQNLAVYDTTSSGKDITVEKIHLIVNPDAGGVGITSIYIVQNWGAIYLGDPPTEAEQRRIGVRFLLPSNSSDFQVMQGWLAAHHAVMPWGFASTIPFFPGSDTLVFSYVIPWENDRATFEVESPYPIRSLSAIAVAGTADLRVEGGEPTPNQMGPQLLTVERSQIPANTPVKIQVLPPGGGLAGSLSAGQWLVIVAAIVMVAVILFAVYVRQKQREAETGEAPSIAPVPVSDEPLSLTGREAVDALVEQIAQLDEAYERDELAEAEYVSRRRALKAELVRALKEEQV